MYRRDLRDGYPHKAKIEALDMYKKGHTTREITKSIGCSMTTLHRWIDGAGLPKRNCGQPLDIAYRVIREDS